MTDKISNTTPQAVRIEDMVGSGSPMDLMSQAALTLHKDAASSREMAREQRRQARQDSLQCHRRAAEKLREMADSALGSAIMQGVATIGSAALELGGTLKSIEATSPQKQIPGVEKEFHQGTVADNLYRQGVEELQQQSIDLARKTSGYLAAGAKGLTALGQVNPLGVHQQYQAVEKKEIENQAMAADDRAKEMSDQEAEGRRLESSSLKLMQQFQQSRHQAMMTAIRG